MSFPRVAASLSVPKSPPLILLGRQSPIRTGCSPFAGCPCAPSTAHRPPMSRAIWNRPAPTMPVVHLTERGDNAPRTHHARLDNVQGAPQVVTPPPPPWLMGSQDRPCRTDSEYWLHSTTVLGTVLSGNRQEARREW